MSRNDQPERENARAILTMKSGKELEVHRLRRELLPSLQQFAEGLSAESSQVFTPHQYDEATLEAYLRRDQAGEDRIYVLTDGRRVVGYFFLWEFHQPIPVLGIGLADDYQGQGLGKQATALLIEDARAAGKKGISLTTVRDNHRAFGLYQKMGFQYVRDVVNVAGDGRRVTERQMFLALADGAGPAREDFAPPV